MMTIAKRRPISIIVLLEKSRIYFDERMNMVAPRSVLVHRGIESLLRHLLDLILDPSSVRIFPAREVLLESSLRHF
jgi:hypothetical protein